MNSRSAAVLVSVLLLCAGRSLPALAQSTEFELTEQGQWEKVDEPEPGSDEALMSRMRRHLVDDEPGVVKRTIDDWLEDPANTGSPLRPQGLLLRADALVLLNREFKALYDYEDIIRNHPQSAEFTKAIERELDIADMYVDGLKLRSLGIRFGDPEPIVREIFIRTGERVPGSRHAERALISLADFYYQRRDMSLARDSYDVYLENFPNGPNARPARARQIFTDIARFKGPRYDASGLIDARVRVRNFLARHSQTAREVGVDEALLTRIDESLAAQLLDSAEWYLTQNDWPSARYVLRRLIREHPESVAAQNAREMLAERGDLQRDSQTTNNGKAAPAPPNESPEDTPERKEESPS